MTKDWISLAFGRSSILDMADLSDSANVFVSILFAEAEVFVETESDVVAI